MAIVEYKCDTCKRTVEIPRNINGLERVLRCTITHGCRGHLYQTNLLEDFQRGGLPDVVGGLDDWIQRKILHNHTQNIERDEWTIKHDMGVYPSVSVFINNTDGTREEIVPNIIIVDDDTIKLQFLRPYSGIAQLIGRQSDPELLAQQTVKEVVAVEPTQITANGSLVIAVISDIAVNGVLPQLILQTTFKTSAQDQSIDYTLNSPTITSPWVSVGNVVLNGKVYFIQSFAAVTPEMTAGVIPNGTTFTFDSVSFNGEPPVDFNTGQFVILYSTEPYETADKVYDKYIDITQVSETLNQFGFYYDSGELYAKDETIQIAFPKIRSI